MTRVPPDAAIAELAARQHGVVARWQLAALGVTPSLIEARIGAQHLIRLHRAVYAVGHRQLRIEGHWLAAVLACGPGAVLSHREAAALHGLRPSNRSRIDVTTPRRIRRARPGIELHHSATVDARDVTTVEGIPVTVVARTLVDLASVVSSDHVAKALREAEHLRIADIAAIERAMGRTRHRPGRGHATLRGVLEQHRRLGTQLTRSALEDAFLALCETHELPRPRTNVWIGAHEVDALWTDERVAVELDGWARHRGRRAFQHDRQKGNAVTRMGYRLLRFTHDDVVRRPAATAAEINALLAGA
jgi:predicted transcriptional regulator of viral defense system/very-short-patch-repair endonuclease